MHTIILTIVTLYLAIQLLTLLSNMVFFPVLKANQNTIKLDTHNTISILIPARNEATNLHTTLPRILQQGITNLEILVLDDNSEDETATIVQNLAQYDTRLRLIHGSTLPEDWGGKNWACHQLAQHANGHTLIFTDADVLWSENALESILSFQKNHDADFISVWPQQITHTWIERISIPAIDMILLGLLPYLGVQYVPWAKFSAGNGQLMLWTRRAYQTMGGHAAFKQEVLEDDRMAQASKATGSKVALALGGRMLAVRMYNNWEGILEGFSKNILAAHNNQRWLLIIDGILQFLTYTLPFLIVWWHPYWLWLGLAGMLQRALTCYKTQRSPWEALLQPLAPVIFWRIAWRALSQHGYTWKGRSYTTNT